MALINEPRAAAEAAGETSAQALQLTFECAPGTPFDAARAETAPPDVLALVESRMAKLLPLHLAGADAPAARPWGGSAQRDDRLLPIAPPPAAQSRQP
ncbi:MAG: hypothetical protein ACLPTZ_15940 [Beijerinckiaceae bacterium]